MSKGREIHCYDYGKSEWKELTIEATTNKGGKKTRRPRRKAKDANFVLQLTNRAKKP
jgi:hypothetical protein